MAELKYEITEKLATLSTNAKGWSLELNKVSWNEREPKFDLRTWDAEHNKMGKGITFNEAEARELFIGLGKFLEQ
ncbi:YdbC family protein [Periweissella fabalis]|uniref:Transcriptional coactivator p15 (PC4) C-terminal domain-containing protein n=1 Tax=Periweissella fabalis TaxID=1070421 RepID=A0A7X6N676_9LACO|nr:PC4/YdbC family ssDNA-binding protein [Periweissella fabalis]MCM0598131.1 hypothetical protein [Periweissella fabalis]NKZ24745.1 hypothetical protein [Periweissella fabalis]